MSVESLLSAFLYFVVYVPFAYLSNSTKPSMPTTAASAVLTMVVAWSLMGLWKRVYVSWRVLLCALFNAGIIVSTIEAMSFRGGPVFKTAMIIKAGVLALMFYADEITGFSVKWRSVLAGVAAAGAIVLMNMHKLNVGSPAVPPLLMFWYTLCIGCYAIKLPLFSKIKRQEGRDRFDFLISHQTFAVLFFLLYAALAYGVPHELRAAPVAVGLFSQLSGVFGSAILLSEEEHSATVPLKTIGAISAGGLAGVLLGQDVSQGMIAGFILLVTAAVLLMVGRKKNA
jgi:hypothetical protein